MSNCTPCSSGSDMSECCPTLIEAGKYVEVNDAFCKARTLEGRKNALLFHGSGKNPVKWSDGSDARPITLDQLSQLTNNGFQSIVITDSAGRVYRSVPDPLLGKQELHYEGGAISWKPYGTNRHSFPNGQILQKEPSSPSLAAFDPCGPDGQSVLYRLPQGYIESLIPMPETFDIAELASNICANALREDDVDEADASKILKLSIICDTNKTKGFPNFFIGEASESAVGSCMTFIWTPSSEGTIVGGTYSSLSALTVFEGASTGIATVSGGVVTIQKAGQFLINAQAYADPIGGGGVQARLTVFKNGSALGIPYAATYVAAASAAGMLVQAFSITLAKNDTIEMRASADGNVQIGQEMLTLSKMG